jgi:hypothetical protein
VEIQVPANIAIKSPTGFDVIGSLTNELFRPPPYPLQGEAETYRCGVLSGAGPLRAR